MIRTVEAIIDQDGNVRLLEPIKAPASSRALVTILDQSFLEATNTDELSESTLAKDWDRPEEDAAWAHLQPAR